VECRADSNVPIIANYGAGAKRKPDFILVDYRTMIRKLLHLINQGKNGKSRDKRALLRDYMRFLAADRPSGITSSNGQSNNKK
jgi:hypothetical protein